MRPNSLRNNSKPQGLKKTLTDEIWLINKKLYVKNSKSINLKDLNLENNNKIYQFAMKNFTLSDKQQKIFVEIQNGLQPGLIGTKSP